MFNEQVTNFADDIVEKTENDFNTIIENDLKSKLEDKVILVVTYDLIGRSYQNSNLRSV